MKVTIWKYTKEEEPYAEEDGYEDEDEDDYEDEEQIVMTS